MRLVAKESYEQAKLDCFLSKFQGSDSFMGQLYRLFCKADEVNQARLGRGFPTQYQVHLDWYNSPSEREFFAEYLTPPKSEAQE